MKYQTIVAAYDSKSQARAAAEALMAAGFHESDISILERGAKAPGFWQRLFGKEVLSHEAAVYDRTLETGGTVVAVRVPNEEVAHATGILDLHHPINLKDRAVTSGVAPAARVETAAASAPTAPMAPGQKVAVSPKLAAASEQVLRLAEEQLQVGKQMLETGKTRVRRFVTEREVTADVSLHEEHAEILRRAISDPKYVGNVDWADSTIEVIETAEQALVSKTARVVEEISLKKIGSDHIQTLHEKLRRQQAEVSRYSPDGKLLMGKEARETYLAK